jgi:hypothetical protein
MADNRDDFEPIIATRPSRAPVEEDAQPVWRLALTLSGGLLVVVFLAWWLLGKFSRDGEPTTEQVASEPTEVVEQTPAPPANDPEANTRPEPTPVPTPTPPAPAAEPAASAEQAATPATPPEPAASAEQAATPATPPEVVPAASVPAPSPPALVSLHFTSPDTQVKFEVRGPSESSPPLTSKVDDVVDLAPGTYRVVASGAALETLEREIVLTGVSPAEYTVELCAQPKQEVEVLTGRIVEERACASTEQCESMFNVLSEHADQLVNDRAFRTQQCAKWRPEAAPDGRWTLDTKCDGATLATTCRIEIAQGACTVTEARRTVRGDTCPRAALE